MLMKLDSWWRILSFCASKNRYPFFEKYNANNDVSVRGPYTNVRNHFNPNSSLGYWYCTAAIIGLWRVPVFRVNLLITGCSLQYFEVHCIKHDLLEVDWKGHKYYISDVIQHFFNFYIFFWISLTSKHDDFL